MPRKPSWVPELEEINADMTEMCKSLGIDYKKTWRRAQQLFSSTNEVGAVRLSPMYRDMCALNYMVGYIGHAIEMRDGKPMSLKRKKPKEKTLAEKVTEGVVVAAMPRFAEKPRFFLPEDELQKLCDCGKACTERPLSEFCALYRKALVERFPVEPFTLSDGREVYRVGDLGNIPKDILDGFVNAIVDRLRTLRKIDLNEYQRERLLWRVNELEDIRRQLHLKIAREFGVEPFDISSDAIALKVIIEEYVEKRAQLFGGF